MHRTKNMVHIKLWRVRSGRWCRPAGKGSWAWTRCLQFWRKVIMVSVKSLWPEAWTSLTQWHTHTALRQFLPATTKVCQTENWYEIETLFSCKNQQYWSVCFKRAQVLCADSDQKTLTRWYEHMVVIIRLHEPQFHIASKCQTFSFLFPICLHSIYLPSKLWCLYNQNRCTVSYFLLDYVLLCNENFKTWSWENCILKSVWVWP